MEKNSYFPFSFLQDNDSFFTKLDDSLSTSRLYCGLMGQGQSPTVSVSWITAAILQSVYELSVEKENDGKPKLTNEEVDNLWTILGYFNSKREFGR